MFSDKLKYCPAFNKKELHALNPTKQKRGEAHRYESLRAERAIAMFDSKSRKYRNTQTLMGGRQPNS